MSGTESAEITTEWWREMIGRQLEDARRAKRLSKRQAAKEAGISEGLWRQLESGKRQLARGIVLAPSPRDDKLEAALRSVDLDPGPVFTVLGRVWNEAPTVMRVLPDGTRRVWVNTELLPTADEEEILHALAELTPENLAEARGYLKRMIEVQRRERMTGA